MKKNIFCLVLLLAATLTLLSCSQKETIKPENPDKRAKQYVFEQLLAGKTSQYFERLMFTPVLGSGTFHYMFELMYPECSGIYDSTGFYSDACDDGSWVDDLLFSMEEERLGEEMLNLLEDEEAVLPPIDFSEQEEELKADETSVEKLLANFYGRLKLMEFGSEYFMPQVSKQGDLIVHYSKNTAVRAFYDDLYRLVKKEHWKMNTIEDSKITVTELYEYEGESKNPVKKIIQNDESKVVSYLNQDGLVIKAEKYTGKEEDTEPVSLSEWEYDSKGRISSQISKEKGIVKKEIFDYSKVDAEGEESKLPPDYECYENGRLIRKTEYTSKDQYSSLINFDSSNSVKSYYKNYTKVKDIYISDGVEIRVRNYE